MDLCAPVLQLRGRDCRQACHIASCIIGGAHEPIQAQSKTRPHGSLGVCSLPDLVGVMPLDAGRFHCSQIPLWLQVVGTLGQLVCLDVSGLPGKCV